MNALADITPPAAISKGAIVVAAHDLKRAVTLLFPLAKPSRKAIPVLGHIIVAPNATGIELTATNLDVYLSVDCLATCGDSAPTFLIRADLIRSLLSGAAKEEMVEIRRIDKDVLDLKVGPVAVQVRELCSKEDFPDVFCNLKATPTTFTVKAEALNKVITNCAPAISTEETRYYLNGIFLHELDGNLAGCTTDGHKLCLYRTNETWPVPAQIFPRHAVPMLSRLLALAGDDDLKVTCWDQEARLRVTGPTFRALIKCIDGTFPDYKRVIPERKEGKGYAVLSPAMLRRVPYWSDSRAAELDLTVSTLRISAPTDGLELTMTIEALGDFSVGFNIKYLKQFASAFGNVRIEGSDAAGPALVFSEDPAWQGVIMPMRIR